MGDHIYIAATGGQFQAYLARPEATPAPAVVVLHEVFGVNADLRQTCDDLAARGFLALSPDLFWRQEPGVDLSVTSEADWQKGLRLYAAYDRAQGVEDIRRAIDAAARLPGLSGRVGLMGYCLGALMTILTAARSGVDAAVWFHGAETEKYLDEVDAITAPMLMHLAGADEFILPEAQSRIKAACEGHMNIEIHSYPGCHHAFSRHGGTHYDAEAAALANRRTWAFLDRHLKKAAVSWDHGL